MSFYIGFCDEKSPVRRIESSCRDGLIRIGEFEERIQVPLSYWDENEYEEQWKDGVGRVLGGHSRSCLLTAVTDPKNTHYFEWWLIYREAEVVFLQNGILFLEDSKHSLDPKHIFDDIPVRETMEDGRPVSEWTVPLTDFEEFYRNFETAGSE